MWKGSNAGFQFVSPKGNDSLKWLLWNLHQSVKLGVQMKLVLSFDSSAPRCSQYSPCMTWQHHSRGSDSCCSQNNDIIYLNLFKLIFGTTKKYKKRLKVDWFGFQLPQPFPNTDVKDESTINCAFGSTSIQNKIHLFWSCFVAFVAIQCGLKGKRQAEEEQSM